MATLQKKGQLYYAVFYDPTRQPKRKYVPLRTGNKRAATAALAALEVDHARGRYDPWDQRPQRPERTNLAEAADAFFDAKSNLSGSTQQMYRFVVSSFVESVDSVANPEALRPSHVQTFLASRNLNATSKITYLRHLRVFVRWMHKEKMIEANPLEGVEPPRKPHKLPKSVTEDELQAVCIAVIMDYQEKHEKGYIQEGDLVWRIPLMLFAFCTGMRASELARLRWGHLDFDKRLITIHVQKNGKEQTIPLNARAVAVLDMVKRGGTEDYVFTPPGNGSRNRTVRPFVERASKAFTAARKLAGINRRITFHGLRHGFCTKLAEAGKPLYVIKEAARHADVSTSMLYVHMANEHLKSELDDVFA
ncbi:MAG: tyrosine-type recombinase/integrase [Rhodothermales bacterium]